MKIALVRPKVSEIAFRLYDRALHPELFDTVAERTVVHGDARLAVRLTPTGHSLRWSRAETSLEEVIASATQELPACGLRLAHSFNQNHRARAEWPGVHYQIDSQLETLQPEQFVHVHEELLAEGTRKGLVFHCKENNRIGLSPLGVVIVEALPNCLSVNAFHTFPDEFAVIKTQSLIEYRV